MAKEMLLMECKCGGPLHSEDDMFVCKRCGSRYLKSRDQEGQPFLYQPVERKHIEAGQMAAKADAIAVSEIVVRQIKLEDDVDLKIAKESNDIDKPARIKLIEGYLSTGDWEKVDEHVNGILRMDKRCAEAAWYSWMCEKKVKDDKQMLQALTTMSKAEAVRLDRVLEYATPAFAKRIITLFMDGAFDNDEMCFHALTTVLPYARNTVIYDEKTLQGKLSKAFDKVIDKTYAKTFDFLLQNALSSDEVDRYITYNTKFADNADSLLAQKYYQNVIAVDPGNVAVRKKLVFADIKSDANCEKTIQDMEGWLQYSENPDKAVLETIKKLCGESVTTANKNNIFWRLMEYHSTAPEGLRHEIMAYGKLLLESSLWNQARECFNLILSFDANCGDAYWGLCLVRMQAKNDKDVVSKKAFIKDTPEYDKALAVYHITDQKDKVKYLVDLSQKQKETKQNKKIALIAVSVVVAIIVLFNVFKAIDRSAKYSVGRVDFEIVSTDYPEGFQKLNMELKNGCKVDIYSIGTVMRFYDENENEIAATKVEFSNLPTKEVREIRVTLDNNTYGNLYTYSFKELKVTIAVLYVNFVDGYQEEFKDPKENVIKNAEKLSKEEIKAARTTLEDAFKKMDDLNYDYSYQAEQKLDEIGRMLDEAWPVVKRSPELCEMIYEKADSYEKNEEYFEAQCLFYLLGTLEYKDSEDRAENCWQNVA